MPAYICRMSYILCLSLRPIDEKEFFRSPGERRIKPVDIVGSEHLVCHISLIHIYMRPLPALRLMARHGVCIFYLHGIIVFICLQTLQPVGLSWYIGVIGHHGIEQPPALLERKRRSL